jgi:glycosyltransferase involved in cell wall biosynthesis
MSGRPTHAEPSSAGDPGRSGDRAPGPHLRIAMALYGDLTYDSRVQREAKSLSAAGYEVTIYCLSGVMPDQDGRSPDPVQVMSHIPRHSRVVPGTPSPYLEVQSSVAGRTATKVAWLTGYARNLRAWGRWAVQMAGGVDVWHVHDMTALMAIAPLISKPTHLIYDSHEIFMATGTAARLPSPARRIVGWLESRLARRATALVTVNSGLEHYLSKQLRPERTVIVRNCAPRWTPPTHPTSYLRNAARLDAMDPVVLYHGRFAGKRGIEELVAAAALPGMEDIQVVLLGYGNLSDEFDRLSRDPKVAGRVHVLAAVKPTELQDWVSGADVGVVTIRGQSLNHRLASPNKLWESLSAGVPVIASDFPVMRDIVLGDPDGPFGVLCDPEDVQAIATAIRSIVDASPEERAEMTDRCRRAADSRLNWDHEAERLVNLYDSLSPR